MNAIEIIGLGKAYKNYSSLWQRLGEWFLPWGGCRHTTHWVLNDISFALPKGQALGIIGMNGAGKSTLLKMIAGTTAPTCGSIRVEGNVAALLELGMGFHPEFTGRENVYLSGQLLGLDRQKIDELMPDIESFAEIGDYIDQPVRVYSSGMQVRLAFGVATAVRPDVLIVDEALSVGDAYFQHKSFDRIKKFREAGTSLLLVSHDKQAIQSVCDRAILLNHGKVAMEGQPEAVMDFYNALLADHQNQSVHQEVMADGRAQTISGTGEATVETIGLLNDDGVTIDSVDVNQSVTLCVKARIHQPIDRLVLGFGIKDRLGQVMFGCNTDLTNQPVYNLKAGSQVVFNVRFPANFGPGSYSIQTALVSTDTHLVNNYEWRDLALVFTVLNTSKTHFAGSVWLPLSIDIETQ